MKNLEQDELLARHTTFRVGGPADWFVRVESRAELVQAVMYGQAAHLEIFILGNGSNILVSDAGFRGLVIENHADAAQEHLDESNGDHLQVIAESGASLPGLANRLARQGWSGLEWAIGVPATVGAAVVTNAGAHGGAVSDNLALAEILDEQGKMREWSNSDLQYDYRTSFLKQHPNAYAVLTAEFVLSKSTPAECVARMNQFSAHRRATQPTEPSVGSMFKNPPGDHAGRLIEAAGLKGTRIGQVEVSNVHAHFFVNRGGATASDVLRLVELVRERVRTKFQVELELEIQLVGEWAKA